MFSAAFSVPQLFGYVAFVLGVSSFLQKNDRHFKLYMAAECIAYVVHFYLLGNPTAVLSSLLSATRSVLSLYTRSPWVAAVVVVVNLVAGGMLVQHWWNWFPPIASCIGSLALFLLHGRKMRIVMLFGTSLWIVNNVISGSIGGTALECVILCVNLSTIWRMGQDQKAQQQKAQAEAVN